MTYRLRSPNFVAVHELERAWRAPSLHGDAGMPALVVRMSSLGDVVHALAVVSDLSIERVRLTLDWVTEEAYVPLVRLSPSVRRVIPVALRRWRGALFDASTWREWGGFQRDLRHERYGTVLNLHDIAKGALVARMARGERHGLDARNARERLSAWFADVRHPVARAQHAVSRWRALAGATFGYEPAGPPCWHWILPPSPLRAGGRPYAVLVHGTSREDKRWPDRDWEALVGMLGRAGLRVVLLYGSEQERRRSDQLAMASPRAMVLDPVPLPPIAALLRAAAVVVGVDTGITHLAAALGVPTLALFTATDPSLTGVAICGVHGRDLGGLGLAPTFDQVAAVLRDVLLRPKVYDDASALGVGAAGR